MRGVDEGGVGCGLGHWVHLYPPQEKRGRERERQTDRQTDRHTDRQTNRQTHTQIDTQTNRQTDTQIDTQTEEGTTVSQRELFDLHMITHMVVSS